MNSKHRLIYASRIIQIVLIVSKKSKQFKWNIKYNHAISFVSMISKYRPNFFMYQ